MPAIVLKGREQVYVFSVVKPTETLPEWGGVYIAVNASLLGMRMESVVAIGACSSFKKYEEKIAKYVNKRCTHLYLLPESDGNRRQIAMHDLAQTEAFQEVFSHLADEDTVPFIATAS